MKHIKYIIFILILALSFSCEKDKAFEFPGPGLVPLREGPPTITQEPGQKISFELELQAANGLSSFNVLKNGQPFDTVTFTDEISGSYLLQYTIPQDIKKGSKIVFSFKLTDKKNETATYELTVLAESDFSEDTITVNGVEVVRIKGKLNRSYKFNADQTYLIDSILSIENNSTLTIDKGSTVYFKTSSTSSLSKLVITQGSKIMAEGTADEPVVFTSDKVLMGQEPTSHDWGGIYIYGNAPTNEGSAVFYLGFRYGGNMPNDNSGILKYVRIEYVGSQDDNHIHGLNLFGVGSRTVVNHIEVFRNENNAFKINGGNVSLKYIAGIGHGGYGIWADHGWQGNGQFWIFQTDRKATLIPVNFWNQARSIEMRNDDANFSLTPRTTFQIANVTLIGNGYTAGSNDEGTRRGVRIRTGAIGTLQNMLVTGFPDDGVRVEDLDLDEFNKNMILDNTESFGNRTNYAKDAEVFFNDNTLNVGDQPVSGITLTNFVGSETSTFDPATLGDFFSSAPFIGAVENSSNDWTSDGNWFKNLDGTIR